MKTALTETKWHYGQNRVHAPCAFCGRQRCTHTSSQTVMPSRALWLDMSRLGLMLSTNPRGAPSLGSCSTSSAFWRLSWEKNPPTSPTNTPTIHTNKIAIVKTFYHRTSLSPFALQTVRAPPPPPPYFLLFCLEFSRRQALGSSTQKRFCPLMRVLLYGQIFTVDPCSPRID